MPTTHALPSAAEASAFSSACGRAPGFSAKVRYRACGGSGARIPGCAFFIPSTSFLEASDRLGDARHRHDLDTVDLLFRLVRLRDDRTGEAELGGLPEALLPSRSGTHLSREADLAEHRELLGDRLVGER